jgi:hypothetical protein
MTAREEVVASCRLLVNGNWQLVVRKLRGRHSEVFQNIKYQRDKTEGIPDLSWACKKRFIFALRKI